MGKLFLLKNFLSQFTRFKEFFLYRMTIKTLIKNTGLFSMKTTNTVINKVIIKYFRNNQIKTIVSFSQIRLGILSKYLRILRTRKTKI